MRDNVTGCEVTVYDCGNPNVDFTDLKPDLFLANARPPPDHIFVNAGLANVYTELE